MSASQALSRAQLDAEQSLLKALEERLAVAQEAERDARGAVDAAKWKLHESSSVVHSAQTAIESFKQSIKQSRALFTPLPTLPLDILAQVIRTWVATTDAPSRNHNGGYVSPAFAAASVCRQWRSAALSISSIWASIYLDFAFLNQANKYLEVVLQRSGSHPLTVDMLDVPADMEHARQLDEALLLRLLTRAQYVCVTFLRGAELTFERSILPYFQLSMPLLEVVKFEGDACRLATVAPGTQILTLAPQLRQVDLMHPTMLPVLALHTLPNIEQFHSTASFTPSGLRAVAAAWPKLHMLSIMGCHPDATASQPPIDIPSLEVLILLSPANILPLLSVVHVPRLRQVGLLWTQSTLSEFAQFLAPGGRFGGVAGIVLTWLPSVSTVHGAQECMTVLAQLPGLTVVTLLSFCAEAVKELFRAWAAHPQQPAKLGVLALQKCEFDQPATHALLNFLVLRQEPSGAGTKIRSLILRQSGGIDPANAFPAWLHPQLERLVPTVDFRPFEQEREVHPLI